jgi:vitamin B12 transporter
MKKTFRTTTKNIQAGVRNELLLGAARLNLLYNYNNIDRDYRDDSTESRNGFYLFNQSAYKAAEHFAEAYVVHPFGKLKLTAGADFRSSHTDFTALTVSPSFNPASPLSGKKHGAKRRQRAAKPGGRLRRA